MNIKKKVIILAAGGTGGHFYPAIALAEKLQSPIRQIHLFTDKRCARYLTEQMPVIAHISNLHLKNQNLFIRLKSRLMLIFSCLQAIIQFIKLKPALVVGFGGYPSLPALFAASLLKVPLVVHEQNAFLGRTNKKFAKFARFITLSYEKTSNLPAIYQEKTKLVGDLVRISIATLPQKTNFNNKIFHLFIFGGSQGAEFFSKLLPELVGLIKQIKPNLQLQITQQVGEKLQAKLASYYQEQGIEYELQQFFHNIHEIYAKADLVIARSGAGTISELTNIGLPAIFIPYPHAADNHQLYNASLLAKQGASWCFEQKNIDMLKLAELIIELATNRTKLRQAAECLYSRKTEGTKKLADIVATIIQ